MNEKKLVIVFPGMGYHKDKPLLYYAIRLAKSKCYEVLNVEFHDMPQKVIGDADMMKKAADIAFMQVEEQIGDISFIDYSEVLFIGKSIGTVVMAKFANEHKLKAKQIWYTPVEATFSFDTKEAIAFIGDEDPWSDVEKVKKMASEQDIVLFSYPKCNHSLECDNVNTNLIILRDVIWRTGQFIDGGEANLANLRDEARETGQLIVGKEFDAEEYIRDFKRRQLEYRKPYLF